MLYLPSELICIITCLLDNKSSCSLNKTCKKLNIITNSNGYITKMSADKTTDMSEFIIKGWKHQHTVSHIRFDEIENPHLWTPFFTRKMSFINCKFSIPLYAINPKTTILEIIDQSSHSIIIKWDFFKNLEMISIYTGNVCLIGIEKLKKISDIHLTTKYRLTEESRKSLKLLKFNAKYGGEQSYTRIF